MGSSLIYFLFLILGIGTISAVLLFLDLAPGFQYANSAILDTLLNKNFIILIIYVFFITLFTEQIVFRKVFKDIINNKYFFIIFSGIIYGILQVGYSFSSINDVLTIIPFAYAGIILNLSYEKTNTIVTPCLVYFFYDLFLLLITIS